MASHPVSCLELPVTDGGASTSPSPTSAWGAPSGTHSEPGIQCQSVSLDSRRNTPILPHSPAAHVCHFCVMPTLPNQDHQKDLDPCAGVANGVFPAAVFALQQRHGHVTLGGCCQVLAVVLCSTLTAKLALEGWKSIPDYTAHGRRAARESSCSLACCGSGAAWVSLFSS